MNTLRCFLHLAAPFWLRRQQWREWLLLAAVVGFSLAVVRVGVAVTAWNKTFYDALAAFDSSAVPALAGEFVLYILMITVFIACGNLLRKILLFRWRTHLTRQLTEQWLAGGRHYRLQLSGEPDNPDQRIAEDVFLLAEKSIDLCKYFLSNAAKLAAFTAVLWQLSGVQRLMLFGQEFRISGYLVWIALVYSALCTLLMHLIGRRLHPLNVERQHREADYRAMLLRVRDRSEQIALYGGAAAESGRLKASFGEIAGNWSALIGREFRVESFSAVYLRISMFIPILAVLPAYLAKMMTFGDMMQARSAFSNVQDGFGWFMDYYKRIIEWSAVVERLAQFQNALDTTDASSEIPPAHPTQAGLSVDRLDVYTAGGRMLLAGVSFAVPAGGRVRLAGASGIGKSVLLKTLAGIWPYHRGGVRFNREQALFLPQQPYLPAGTLRAAVCYPGHTADDAAVCAALETVGLGRLKDSLDCEAEWERILSGGEQQRLSLARVFVRRPAILFLDEATGRLDDAAAEMLMREMMRQLPESLMVAVSHQSVVQDLFDHTVDLPACIPDYRPS